MPLIEPKCKCGHVSSAHVDTGCVSCECTELSSALVEPRVHSHYFKNVAHLKDADVYRVLLMFDVRDPCLQHSIKKLLVAGGRGGGKDITRDVQEAIDTLVRWQEMRVEDQKEGNT